ncbi:MAG TPA: DUF2232 domain-containing protein [Gemmatimonadaceae bacterium]|nr:DUF2232 domain-containing protein [Gemmatimonadaceae bacterium]
MTQVATPPSAPATTAPSAPPGERGWGKLILGLVAFLLLPTVPQFRALIPIDQTMLLFVPALAGCALVGWWAGGRPLLAATWVALATLIAVQRPQAMDAFHNLSRGWSLVLAGSFGLVCLFGARRAFFPRALIALMVALGLALMMSVIGPVTGNHMGQAVRDELTRRNSETMGTLNTFIGQHPKEWTQLTDKVPQISELPAETEKQLALLASAGETLFPSLLALESILALAIAWSMYHRLSRARLGPPLGALRDFRFNDQLVWGLIVGLTIVFLPTLASVRIVGRNMLLFFSALYALRGLGVLSWFMAPGALTVTATVGFAMLLWPVLNAIAAIGFLLLGIAAFGLGLGDTWADWRSRPRTSP